MHASNSVQPAAQMSVDERNLMIPLCGTKLSLSNIHEAIQRVRKETSTLGLQKTCSEIEEILLSSRIKIKGVVKALALYLTNIKDAETFKRFLPNILLAIVASKIPLVQVFSHSILEECSEEEKTTHIRNSIMLSVLCDHPDIRQYTLNYFEINNVSPFDTFISREVGYKVEQKRRRFSDCPNSCCDYDIVQCCYYLLRRLPNELANKWDWSKFVSTFGLNTDSDTLWMVKECMVIIANMTEIQARALTDNLKLQPCEAKVIQDKKSDKICNIAKVVKDKDLSRSVVNIDGILLPLYVDGKVQKGNLVPVMSTVNNLRSLALAVASGKALSLMGPVGSGKTSLVEHLAAITGRKGTAFKKVQLGDQTDSRMLLGSHQCTDIPGEFVWRAGVLTQAVQNGHWLLLEDIDCATLDVASTLSSLLERNTLCVPGYCDSLPVTPGFQLFVTQRTITTNYGFQKKMSNSSTLLQKHLTQINVEPLSRAELSGIIQILYPKLSTIVLRIMEVFMMFSVGSHDTSLQATETTVEKVNIMRGSRLISTRDLMKWCSRSVQGFDVSSPESALKVLQDALDIFTCSASSPEDRLELSKKVGTCLGIVDTKSEFYCKYYKPNVSLTAAYLEVGRARVPRVEKSLESIDFDNREVVFSFTRQSACLLERIACCVMSNEPVLLVGETGTGKTSSVQYLARQTGHKLVVINMNQQSDSADLLGGYKPVNMKYVIRPIKERYEHLFKGLFNVELNKKFLGHIETCFETENWTDLVTLMKKSCKAGIMRLMKENGDLREWSALERKLEKLDKQVKAASRLTFAFIEGSLVKAMQEGHWVLLDEINLASAEILECLAGLLEDKNESIDLLEKGDRVPIKRHPNFTLFACMNPATDVGKKDLPVGLRNRFTEFFIDELNEKNDLMQLIGDYLYHINLSRTTLEAIYSFYETIRKEAKLSLVDGSGNTPHYSLRTLCRALTAAAKAKCGTIARSLYEAFCLSFLTQLDSSSHPVVEAMIAKAVIGKKYIKSVLNQSIPEPQSSNQKYLLFEGHWIPQGQLEIDIPEGYILTQTVKKNLRDISRIISLGRLPVLLQGDTSVGKTSLITYIAKTSGNYCVRINNHEHTDLQEYIGSYATDANGRLVFKEGVLVEAMRKGYWIILDELNLAPSDVLEALNRVLDDNRELFIPETQEVIRAHPNFMLFATQNPPGLYGGRKMLSRAFRNRFVELHFDEIPKNELETILHQRCHVPPAYSKKMINVMADLQIRRRGSAAVQGKDGFITLRDLFRWGERYKHASKESLTDDKFYDWDQHIADEGYLVLAGKVRKTDERSIIEEVILKNIKRSVNPDNLFSLHQATSPVTKLILETILNNQLEEFSHVVWTYNMRRLAILIAKAFTFNEPVLLVGETGCGKTTICQVLAALKKRQLMTVNCHMHTESSDFLGGLRPVRHYNNDGRLFEWVDGPLINAMETGNMFLADEISLADDSVLERLNSLLEPERQLVLSERGMEDNSDIVVITAQSNFHFIGTMNPGGDFGKKELSPALRNRFTEIWCDSVTSREDLLKVLEKSVIQGISLGNQEDGSSGIGSSILDFTDWLKNFEVTNKFPFSIRDLLSWVHFINTTVSKGLLDTPEAYVHGACMTFLDCFGTALTGHIDSNTLVVLRTTAINFLLNQIKMNGNDYSDKLREMLSNKQTTFTAESDEAKFGIKPFYIEVGQNNDISKEERFTFTAPTTGANTLRLLRGLQLNKPILLEGNPGVGKTSLVTALAKSSGHKVVRINLSDQTDITDLFGTDLPTEDGSFAFKQGAFLNALQNGDWILLDELNLAPQPVLEGLNACLDHRGEVFIPELGRTFKVKAQTKLFACQNPLKQGGARRGLPLSFLNRFTQVYIDTLTKDDLIYIVESQYSDIPKDILHRIVSFNCKVAHEITELQSWAHKGSPWEMNLRDIQRWCEALIQDKNDDIKLSPGKFVDMLYVNRMRTVADKEQMIETYDKIFLPEYPRSDSIPQFLINDLEVTFGDVKIERNAEKQLKRQHSHQINLMLLRNQMPSLKAIAQCTKMNWLTILVGPSATGKSSIVQVLADLTGNDLQVVPVTSAMDVSDLLGGFEQVDYNRTLENLFEKIHMLTMQTVRNTWLKTKPKDWRSCNLMTKLFKSKWLQPVGNDMNLFNEKIEFLLKHCDLTAKYNEPMSEIRTKLEIIMKDLENLKAKASKATSVNAGGKFEWIDSLLVKTLVEGSWLLLDNVNLTSAAVLDRLNALLEPNGVLSIPERGDVCDIKPHPNFRVFFTMDPKYGEISRAMRNRGVELYLLRDDYSTTLSESMTNYDVKGLLASTGLLHGYHNLCISCHELMASCVQGLEKPTVSHLLQASHLLWQQLLRGIPVSTALINSFSDVYIKPRTGVDFVSDVTTSLAEHKNNMLQMLQENLEKMIVLFPDIRDSSHTLEVKGLCTDSGYVLARQMAFPTIQELSSTSTAEGYWHVLSSMYIGYQKCPKPLRKILFAYLDDILDKKTDDSILKVADQLNKGINTYLMSTNKKMESYKRFYPETYKLNAEEVKAMNIEDALMFYQLGKIISEMYINEKRYSILHYSRNVLSKRAVEEYVEYPILKYCNSYLNLVDMHIVRAISNATEFDDVTACKILRLFNYRCRIVKLASEPILTFDSTKNRQYLNEDKILELNATCKGLQKHLMGELFKLSPDKKEADSFYNQVNVMTNQDDQCSKLMKLGKKLKKLYGQPKLCANEEEYNQSVQRSTVYKKITLNMGQPLSKQMEKLSTDGATVTDVSLAFDIPDTNKLSLIEENIPKALVKTPQTVSDAMLLPITSYVIQRVLCLLQTDFHDIISMITEEKEGTTDVTVLTSLVQFCRLCKGFPPKFLNLLEAVLVLVKSNDNLRVSSVPSKFWDEYYKAVINSPASHPLPFLSLDKPLEEGSMDDIPRNTKRLSQNLPLMPYYVQKFTVTGNADSRHLLAYETVSLENRANYSKQLDAILNVIWKNIAIVDSSAVLKTKRDADLEMKKYERLISCLISIVTQKLATSTENLPTDPIELLKLYFIDSNEYVKNIIDAQTIYKELQNELSNDLNKMKAKILTASLSLMTSLLFAKVMAEINQMDQIQRYNLRKQCITEDTKTYEALLDSYYFHGLLTGTLTDYKGIEMPSFVRNHLYSDDSFKKVHPHCAILMDLVQRTRNLWAKYALGETFRPKEPDYRSFVNDCKHFTKSVLSAKTVNDIYLNIAKTCSTLFEYLQNNISNKTVISNALTVVKETNSWLYSVDAFYKKIENTYSDAFPDLAKPIQNSLSQILYSVTTATDLVKEMIVKIDQGPIRKEVVDLIQYPIEIPKINYREEYLNRFVNPKFTNLVKRNVMVNREDGYSADIECLEVLKMNLIELKMHCVAKDTIDKPSVDGMLATLNSLYKTWEQQQRNIQKKKDDDEALYVTKSKCEDEDEEAIAFEEIQEMFPSYVENDFGEFKPPSLEQRPVKKTQTPETNKIKLLISNEDVSLVYKWHSNFVRAMTSAEWLPSKKKLVGNDVISSFLQRYPIFSQVIEGAWEALDADVEGTISPSLMVLISQIKTKIDGNDSNSKVDFYRSPWVSETRQCVPLLQNVKEATNELLEQWPDFPTLKEIIVIIDRILSFPVTSPVSRFLTGLELLRDKIEEWNKNSHKGNNMIDMSLAVGQQIINWRKLEMAHWKECLNNLYQRKQSEAHKYWFFIYSVINDHLQAEIAADNTEAAKVTEALKNFMETSNLAEYEVRLDIIYVYHCHLVHLEPSHRRDELISILWNTYNYYAQFSAQVASHIKEKRAPIEKKLRDFVKICSWDRDLSYWSVKDTVDKAHKALHKHTKEFENVLKESVRNCLVDSGSESIEHVGIWDRPKRATASAPAGGAYMIDPTNHIVLARNIKKYLDEAEQPCRSIPESSLIAKVGNLLNKAKALCKDTITNSGYPALVQALDDFVTTVIETSTHLGSLEVDASLPKEKQTSQAKNIVQQKRKALADLFKYLFKMGLNYRTGLVILAAASGELHDFTIPPVDLDAAVGYLKSRRCDASLAMLWSGCEKYFQKNIARHRLLSAALLTPHQDLGIQNIERCKGFAAQLLQLTNTQKKSISKYSRRLCDLRNLTTNLMNALEVDAADSNISTVQQKFDVLTECYANAGIILEQFYVVLKSCPEKTMGDIQPDFDAVVSDSKIVRCYKNSEEWKDLNKEINTLISDIGKQKNALQKAANTMPQKFGFNKDLPFISQSNIDTIEDSRSDLELIDSDVDRIINEYQIRFKTLITDFEPNHPLLRSIVELSAYLKDTIKEFDKLNEINDVYMESSSDELIGETEDLIATLLLVIQSVYKKHLPQENENMEVFNAIDDFINNGEKAPEEAKDILEDKHLKELLQDKITSDTRTLQLDTLVSKVRKLLVNYVQYIAVKGKDIEIVRSAVMRLVPILEQAVLFVQYFVTQKVAVHRVSCKMLSVLLKIFSDLATKGFCKPSDLDMEDGDGEGGPGKLSGGTGLGDGEGQKDVSEKIENQDQLDDAQRPGEEKKEEERDCKEEEKGVNMTDDFDSHLQDVEKKDGENSDEDDNEDNADKQMGDTDNAAEKLDQQIWGDEDEEPDQSDQKEKEDKGPGESTGEKQMAAKEKEQGTDDGNEGKDKNEKKDINEINEPEVDDDHVDPYHGNQQPLPEPEDFEMPQNMDVDGEEGDDQDGETETENPFEIDVMKDTIPEQQEEEKEKKERDDKIIDLSSDEEDGNEEGSKDEGAKDDGTNEEGTEKDKDEQPDKTDEDQTPEESDKLDNTDAQTEEEKQETEGSKNEELQKNNEDITEEDKVEEKSHDANPQANPSSDDPTADDNAETAEMDKGTNDNVETNAEQAKDEDAAPFEQAQEQVGEDKQSTGRSELDKSDKGHRGEKQAASRSDTAQQKQKKHENKPGMTDQERTLGNINEKKHKQKTLNVEREDEDAEDGGDDENQDKDADAFQHVKQAKNDDVQAIDAATKEQAEQQPTIQQEEEDGEEMKEDEQVAMEVDEDDIQVEKSDELKPEKMKEGTEKDKEKSGNKKDGADEPAGETGIEVEGERVETETVPRGKDTTYHTRLDEANQSHHEDMSVEQYMSIREWLVTRPQGDVSSGVWRSLWLQSGGAARALCERLRLVLEPTLSSRRAGDFRTGRAINMRRVIPYIASHFRKDRIWLRRTKPAKREYKIAIAVDDSSSMADNRSKELAFESLALVSQALNLLESGELAVLSFGEKPNLLHPFTEQFSEHSGAKILEQLRFEQTKTKIAQLLDFCTVMFEEQAVRSDAPNAKLLVIVGDGRNIFAEGETTMVRAVRRARQQGIFLVYVIIDNPENRDSIMDIRKPVMDTVTDKLSFISYLDAFPFPFYLILRDMSALPNVLGDALRQWFELAANTN